MKIISSFVAGLAALFMFTILCSSWYTIDETERGVLLRNGALVGVAEPGLHFKMPFMDGVEKFSTQSIVTTWDKVMVYSKDQQPATVSIAVTYHVNGADVVTAYKRYGSWSAAVEREVYPVIPTQLETVFGRFEASTAIQERAKLNAAYSAAVKAAVTGPVVIDNVAIKNIDFSDEYEKAVEARMQAEVAVAKEAQNAEREKQLAIIAVTQANARADSVRAEAKAAADAVRMKGQAEATAIDAKGKALKDNPALVGLIQAERWDGKLPATMVPGSALPMLSIGGK